jgi:hypothetical protein
MTLTGQALPLLEPDTDLLTFEASDVLAGRAKHVIVSGNRFTTLADWAVMPEGESFAVRDIEVLDARRIRFSVLCTVPADIEVVSEAIRVTARVTECQRPIGEVQATIKVPVRGLRYIDLSVTPTVLPVAVDPATGDGRGSLLFRGDALGKPNMIKSVRCGGRDVEWKVTESTAGRKVVLTVTIRGITKADPIPGSLLIEVEGRGVLTVPIILAARGS